MAFAFLLTACEQTPTQEALQENEYRYEAITLEEEIHVLTKYASNTLMSIRLADLAVQQAQNEKVKALAEKMSADHRQLYEELKVLADNYNMALPAELSEEKKETINTLKGKDGTAFDKMYLASVVSYHEAFEDSMENVMEGTEYEQLITLARAIDSHNYVHLNRAKTLMMEMDS